MVLKIKEAGSIDFIVNAQDQKKTKESNKSCFIVNGKDQRKRKFFEGEYSIDSARKKETEVFIKSV